MNYILQAKSSSGEPYQVEINENNELLTIHCNCPAGKWGKMCKHKINLLKGDVEYLYDLNEVEKLKEIEIRVKKSSLFHLLDKVDISTKQVKKIESKKKKDQKKILEKMDKSDNELDYDTFRVAYEDIIEMEREIAFNKYIVSRHKSDVEQKFKQGF